MEVYALQQEIMWLSIHFELSLFMYVKYVYTIELY